MSIRDTGSQQMSNDDLAAALEAEAPYQRTAEAELLSAAAQRIRELNAVIPNKTVPLCEETRLIQTKEPFVTWLGGFPPQAKFGAAADKCPLAQYSGDSVGWERYHGGDLPEWAVVFVRRFVRGRGPKTAQHALKIMRGLL